MELNWKRERVTAVTYGLCTSYSLQAFRKREIEREVEGKVESKVENKIECNAEPNLECKTPGRCYFHQKNLAKESGRRLE